MPEALKIVLPTDFSAHSEAAVDWVKRLSERGHAEVHCVNVVQQPMMYMPVMSGTDATRLIRQMGGGKSEVPIIALTADAMTENRTEYAAAGMDECVTKPIDRRELMLAINDVLGKSIHSASDEPVPEPNADAMASVPEEQELTDDVLSFLADIDGLTDEPRD